MLIGVSRDFLAAHLSAESAKQTKTLLKRCHKAGIRWPRTHYSKHNLFSGIK